MASAHLHSQRAATLGYRLAGTLVAAPGCGAEKRRSRAWRCRLPAQLVNSACRGEHREPASGKPRWARARRSRLPPDATPGPAAVAAVAVDFGPEPRRRAVINTNLVVMASSCELGGPLWCRAKSPNGPVRTCRLALGGRGEATQDGHLPRPRMDQGTSRARSRSASNNSTERPPVACRTATLRLASPPQRTSHPVKAVRSAQPRP
jgi:hypothetical protein